MRNARRLAAPALAAVLLLAAAPAARAQSASDICDAYRGNYAKEQAQIDRMKVEPYKSNRQKRLDEKRRRLEEQCAGMAEQLRRDAPDQGKLARLPNLYSIAKDRDEALQLADQAHEARLLGVRFARDEAYASFRKQFAACGGNEGCQGAALSRVVQRQAQLDRDEASFRLLHSQEQIAIREHFPPTETQGQH